MTDKEVMYKRELIREVARRTGKMKESQYPQYSGLTREQIQTALNLILDVITDQMAAGGAVTLVGFGRFEAKEHAGRRVEGLDGETYQVEARLVPSFHPYPALRAKVAGQSEARFKRPPRPIPLRWSEDPES